MAMAKGLAFASKKPLIAVPTLLALATATSAHAGIDENIVPVIKARRGEVYTASFVSGNRLPNQLEPERILSFIEFREWLKTPAIVCGNAVGWLNENGIIDNLEKCRFIPQDQARLSGGVVALIGENKLAAGEIESLEKAEPHYIQHFEIARLDSATQKVNLLSHKILQA